MMEGDAIPGRARIAYFSMEIALESEIPTCSGGLGVLAGDTLRSAADLGLPMIGVTLLHRKGYFVQSLDANGHQLEAPVAWPVDEVLEPTDGACIVEVGGTSVTVRAWRYSVGGVGGVGGSSVPVILLDTDVPGNDADDRRLTDHLYGGDDRYRLCQELSSTLEWQRRQQQRWIPTRAGQGLRPAGPLNHSAGPSASQPCGQP